MSVELDLGSAAVMPITLADALTELAGLVREFIKGDEGEENRPCAQWDVFPKGEPVDIGDRIEHDRTESSWAIHVWSICGECLECRIEEALDKVDQIAKEWQEGRLRAFNMES